MKIALQKLISPLVLLGAVILLITQASNIHHELGLPDTWLDGLEKGLAILGWFIGMLFAIRIMRIVVWEGFVQNTIQRHPPRLIMQLGNVLIIFLTFSGVMAFVFDQSVTAFWTASGAVGIVIGFALQNLILDTFSGLAIHMERPFKVGDWVNCHTRFGEYIGRVEETNWRTTRLWTTSRNMVIIPNSFMTTTIVTNFSMPDANARFELTFTLDYAVTTDRAIRVLTAAAQHAVGPKGPMADPAPKVRVNNVTEYGVEYKMRYYLDPAETSPSKARNTIVSCVVDHLNHAGITLTYPKRDLYLARMPWRQKSWEYPKDQITQLNKLSLFKRLDMEDLEFISQRMDIRQLKRGNTVVTQGDAGNSMFILAEGLLEVLVEREDKELIKVADLAPGTFLGEKSLLTGEPRSATIICATDIVICEITKSVMSELFDRNEKVAGILSKAVAMRDLENMKAMSLEKEEASEEDIKKETALFLGKLKNFFGLKAA